MEFMNNGDLKEFIEANKSLGIRISEEKLWDIFFKCLSGLYYIHQQGLIHRDIKPANLFLDDELNIKIGDFNISVAKNAVFAKKFLQPKDVNDVNKMINSGTYAGSRGYMAPEIYSREYDEKVDIYSMGIVFFELSYGCFPYEPMVIKENLYKQNNNLNELNNLIDAMIQKDPANRISSNKAYLTAKKYFIKNCVKNTAIEATLKCFYNFPNFTEYFCNNDYIGFLTDNKREIGTFVFSIIQSLRDNKNEQFNELLYDLRSSMTKSGLNTSKDNEEIDPGKFISFFIKKLNTELNEIIEVNNNAPKDLEQYKYFINNFIFRNGQEEKIFNDFFNI
jgi:serine/threonine protein kinase